MTIIERKSFCRWCSACCGVRVTVEEGTERVIEVRGDPDDLLTSGYACIKGLQAPDIHNSPDRILAPLKRQPDGSFVEIDLEQALDEIAQSVSEIIKRDGAHAIGGWRGSGAVVSASNGVILHNFLEALGSPKSFSPYTIDQSAKNISVGRLGIWPPGRHSFFDSDVRMFFGVNPLVSVLSSYFDMTNPTKRMREARARGMKFIVIDPRRTETAIFADVFLQPYPGEDPTIVAGMLRIILKEQWEDKAFCAQHVGDLDELRKAVEPYSPEYVAHRAGINVEDLWKATTLFARDSKRGGASSGTGPNMSPRSNLTEHLIECLNVVCGRYLREGEVFRNPSVLRAKWPRKAQVIPAPRWWEHGYKSRIGGYGTLNTMVGTTSGEMMAGIFADEILEPGEGQIRCLFAHGSNIANICPDQEKTVRALRSLELLVSVEPYMNETARLSHYILPTTLYLERADLTHFWYAAEIMYNEPYARYTPPVSKPPAGSKVVDDWIIFYKLAQRLKVQIAFDGVPLDMTQQPTTDDLISIVSRFAPVSLERLKTMELGKIFREIEQIVQPADPDSKDRFTTCPADVADELRVVAAERVDPGKTLAKGQIFTHRLASRRIRDVLNSSGRNLPAIRKRMPYNYAYLNPADIAALGIDPGGKVRITSDNGTITAVVRADDAVRTGVVSMAHGWGSLPGETVYERDGANTGLLISTSRNLDPINAMPRMSAVPVNLEALRPTTAASCDLRGESNTQG
jgi:anaerobic selenocysteine-containing dehydrogenase